jgi:hypothetical protein
VETPQGTTVPQYLNAGANPPSGVIIHYTLPENVEGEVTLRFLDSAGNEVRKFTSAEKEGERVPVASGANRFVWDLRYEPPTALEEGGKPSRRLQQMDNNIPPKAAPGEYQVELKVGDEVLTESFTLLKDPRVSASNEELVSQFELKLAIRDRVSELNAGLNRLRRIRAQIEATEERAKVGGGNEELEQAAKALKDELTAIEKNLTLVDSTNPRPGPVKAKEKFGALSGMIDESDDPPTMNAHEVYTLLSEQVEEELTKIHHIASEDAVSFNNLVQRIGVPAVAP